MLKIGLWWADRPYIPLPVVRSQSPNRSNPNHDRPFPRSRSHPQYPRLSALRALQKLAAKLYQYPRKTRTLRRQTPIDRTPLHRQIQKFARSLQRRTQSLSLVLARQIQRRRRAPFPLSALKLGKTLRYYWS